MGWLYVPGLAASSWASDSPATTGSAPSVTWRGKPMPPRRWWRAWMTVPWTRRLSGTTLPPSTAARGVASWISSLRDTRASRSASPATDAALRILATSGPTWRASLTSAAQTSLFSRTSPAICHSALRQSPATWNAWVSALRAAYSAREGLEHPTAANGSSSWPTGNVTDANSAARHTTTTGVMHPGTSLTDAVRREFPTPSATPYGTNRGGSMGRTGPERPSLETMMQDWPTPAARD